MAIAIPTSRSIKRAINGASRSAKRVARRAESKGHQLGDFLGHEGSVLARRASDLYSSTAAATRKHPLAAVSIVAGIAALLGGLWYAARNR